MIQSSALTIRDRGQLTIPEEIREAFSWLSVGAVVRLVAVGDEVKMLPYTDANRGVNWVKIREGIVLARSFKGKQGDLAGFIARDRMSH